MKLVLNQKVYTMVADIGFLFENSKHTKYSSIPISLTIENVYVVLKSANTSPN